MLNHKNDSYTQFLTNRGKVLAACVLLFCMLHLFVRVYGINTADFSPDEVFTWHFSKHIASAWADVLIDVHPPTHVLLMSVWQKMFGESETSLRLVSVIFSFLSLLTLLMYSALLKDHQKLRFIIFISLLFCFLPYEIYLARYARSYTMLTFFCTAFAYCYYRLIIYGELRFLTFSILLGAVSIYTHFQAAFFLVSALLSGLLCGFSRSVAVTSSRVALGIGVLCIPLLPAIPFQCLNGLTINLLSPSQHHIKSGDLITLFSPRSQGFDIPWTDYGLLDYLGLSVLFGAGLFLAIEFRRTRRFPLTWALLIQMVLILMFFYISPLKRIHDRSMCILVPPAVLLLAIALARLNHPVTRNMAIAFVVSFTAVSLTTFPYPRVTNTDWKSAWSQITPLLEKSESPVLFITPFDSLLVMQYFMSRGIIKTPPTSIWVEGPAVLLAPWGEKLKVNLNSHLKFCSSKGNRVRRSNNFWSTMCRIFAEDEGVSDIFHLRTGQDFEPTRVSQGLPFRQVNRFGYLSLYHMRRVDCAWCILFDSEFYLQQNPDVAEAGVNPLAHFINSGAQEKRDPHPLFNVAYYLKENPDVAEAGVNPLVHFLEHVEQQRRSE